MKKLYLLFLVLCCLSEISYSQGGIPLQADIWDGYLNTNYNALIDSMKKAGVSEAVVDIKTHLQRDFLKSKFLKTVPMSLDSGTSKDDWIQYYSDAKYSIWEAEGEYRDTAYLQFNKNKMNYDSAGGRTFLRLNPVYSHQRDSLIWGPYTYQELKYYITRPREDTTVT